MATYSFADVLTSPGHPYPVIKAGLYRIWCGVHTLGDRHSAIVNPAVQVLFTYRVNYSGMDGVGIYSILTGRILYCPSLSITFHNMCFMRRVSAVASLIPYIAVYMKMLGLTLTETALICGALPFVGGVTRPMIGGLADKLNAHKQTFIALSLLTAVFYSSMLFAPHRPTPAEIRTRTFEVQMHCGKNGVHVFACGDRPLTVGSTSDGYSYLGASVKGLSFNASGCRWTCNGDMQQYSTVDLQAQTMSFTRSNQADYMILNRTASFEFGLNTLQQAAMDNCPNMSSQATDIGTCRCYNLYSYEAADDSWEGLACEEPTRLICTTDCHLDEELSFGNSILRIDSRGTVTDRKGLQFGPVFWSVAITYFFGDLLMQPIFGLTDAMTFGFLGEERNKWGKQRLFGTLGYSIFGPMSGLLMDTYSLGHNKYAAAFLLYAFFMVMSAACVCQYNAGDRRVPSSPPPKRLLNDISDLIRKPEAVVFLSLVFVFGVYFGVITSFLFWHLKLLGDAPQALLGLCILCSCSVEAFVMFFSERIFRVVSQQNCFAFVFVAYAVRFAGYSLITNPWMVLIIEPLHAVTFGLMYASASTYACRITPPGAHGSVQNIVSSLHTCFGKYPG